MKVREPAERSASLSLVNVPPMAVSNSYKNLCKKWLLFFIPHTLRDVYYAYFFISLLFSQYNLRDISMTGHVPHC